MKVIDFQRVEKAFAEYVSKYDKNNGKIKLKIEHIKRVAKNSRKIATELQLTKEEIDLAELIGWLHDIGRFEQVKRYNTFIDKISINHGKLGAQILFEDGLIRKFVEDPKYDEIIRKAIVLHNTTKVPNGLSSKEEIQARIIRDSDKIDIYRVLTTDTIENIYGVSSIQEDTIKEEIMKQAKDTHYIDYRIRENPAEILISHLILVYDINYKSSLEIIKENQYITKLANRFTLHKDTYPKVQEIAKMVNEYLEEKTK